MAIDAARVQAGTPGTSGPSPNAWRAISAWGLAAVIFLLARGSDPQYSMFWVFGLAFGFVLQRGRFCFASAFRDLFLLGHGRTMKGVLLGLAVASVGFGIVMARQVPVTTMGFDPPSANVLPIGVHTALGGILFGVGMVLAGGCVSGSLYRMGEGYVASWVAFAGVMAGLLVSAYTWNWWWEWSMSTGSRLWLPRHLGHSGALVATLLALGAAFVWVIRLEHRAGMVVPAPRSEPGVSGGVADDLRALGRTVFVRGWPVVTAGAVLGGLNALLFTAQEPWGFTGEVGRLTVGLAGFFGAAPPPPEGVGSLPGCVLVPWTGVLDHMTFHGGRDVARFPCGRTRGRRVQAADPEAARTVRPVPRRRGRDGLRLRDRDGVYDRSVLLRDPLARGQRLAVRGVPGARCLDGHPHDP